MSRYPTLTQLGWKPCFEQQLAAHGRDDIVPARVAIHHGIRVGLWGERGEFNIPVQNAHAAGDFGVGDWLVLNDRDLRALQRLERQTVLLRHPPGGGPPQILAANVDTLFITTSCNEDFNVSRLERYLALALQSGARPVVVLTKADLGDDVAALIVQAEALHADLPVVAVDARCADQSEQLLTWCGPGETVALLGSSGVGKSTLANALGALGQATGEIREHDAKGRHTTTTRSLHRLPSGGVLIDNPGIRELQLSAADDAFNDLFEDFFAVAARCRFRNCRHEDDKGCAVRKALRSGELDATRIARFRKLVAEQAEQAKDAAQRHLRDPITGKKLKPPAGRHRHDDEDDDM